MFDDIQELPSLMDAIAGAIGSDDPETIQPAIADITRAKEIASSLSEQVKIMQNDLEYANKRSLELQQANNRLMRQVAVTQEKEKEDEKEELNYLDMF